MGELTRKQFWADVAVRAIRTMAQTALASMTVGATVSEVDWGRILSASAVAGVYSVLMSMDKLSVNAPPSIPGGTAEHLQALADGMPPQMQMEGDGSQ